MRLDLLLEAVEVLDLEGDPATDVVDVTYASSQVHDGTLFCCLPGLKRDGHDFAGEAVERGATALLVDHAVHGVPATVAQARVADTRSAMGFASAALHGWPSRRLKVVGVTGTNGKSTTTMFVRAIFEYAGIGCGVVGTMNAAHTTPEAPDLQRALAGFVADGAGAAAIEVSSVGLVQRRVDGVEFAVAIFTNLTPDELWIHGSVEEYFRAKAMLFEPERTAVAVVNVDAPWAARLADEIDGRVPLRRYSLADAHDLDVRVGSSAFRWAGELVTLPMDATFNVANAIAALTATRELGIDPALAAAALTAMAPIEGHGEPVDAGQPFRVVVDFAHTAGALAAVLSESRRATRPGGRVIAVFGCGGDRDPGRRAPMGEAAAAHAEVVIVTSDNPRTEDPLAIIDAVAEGARAGARELHVVPDRREAIEAAIALAHEGDVIVIAGKGHETGQIIGTEVFPFDDRSVALDGLRARGFGVGVS